MKKREYIEPLVESIEVVLEQGVALSVQDDWNDGGGVNYDPDGNPV